MYESRWSMDKKKLMFFLVLVLLLTGCTRITDDLDSVINAVMMDDKTSLNTVSTGYELFVPIGVRQVIDNEYNQKFRIKDRNVYLYVDTISYYYKNMLNYKSDGDYNYYYKELSYGDKTGYIGINEVKDDLFFCEIIYNYSKMEFYSDYDKLSVILANALIIQNSIKYNDALISLELESNINDGREIKYQLEGPKESESKFSQYLQEYVAEEDVEVVLPGED